MKKKENMSDKETKVIGQLTFQGTLPQETQKARVPVHILAPCMPIHCRRVLVDINVL